MKTSRQIRVKRLACLTKPNLSIILGRYALSFICSKTLPIMLIFHLVLVHLWKRHNITSITETYRKQRA